MDGFPFPEFLYPLILSDPMLTRQNFINAQKSVFPGFHRIMGRYPVENFFPRKATRIYGTKTRPETGKGPQNIGDRARKSKHEWNIKDVSSTRQGRVDMTDRGDGKRAVSLLSLCSPSP